MTDNEIIEALKICLSDLDCPKCPYVDYEGDELCSDKMLKDTLDLINRQKAEIERLNGNLFTISNACKQRRDEAVKEFAEKIKISLDDLPSYSEEDFIYVDEFELRDKIDNLVKEMVGDSDV